MTESELLDRLVAIRDLTTDEETRKDLNSLMKDRWGRASV